SRHRAARRAEDTEEMGNPVVEGAVVRAREKRRLQAGEAISPARARDREHARHADACRLLERAGHRAPGARGPTAAGAGAAGEARSRKGEGAAAQDAEARAAAPVPGIALSAETRGSR